MPTMLFSVELAPGVRLDLRENGPGEEPAGRVLSLAVAAGLTTRQAVVAGGAREFAILAGVTDKGLADLLAKLLYARRAPGKDEGTLGVLSTPDIAPRPRGASSMSELVDALGPDADLDAPSPFPLDFDWWGHATVPTAVLDRPLGRPNGQFSFAGPWIPGWPLHGARGTVTEQPDALPALGEGDLGSLAECPPFKPPPAHTCP